MTVNYWNEITSPSLDNIMASQGSPTDPNSNYSRICRALNAGLDDLLDFTCTDGHVHLHGQPSTPQVGSGTKDPIQKKIDEASISMSGGYIGPDYALPLSNLELLSGSTTYDNARGGMTVKWMDFLGTTH